MIKEAVIGLFTNAPNRTVADRYYLRFHGPDVVRISGPWLRGYLSWQAYDPPVEAVERFGGRGGRYTELWYTSMEEWLTRPPLYAATPPPIEEWESQGRPHEMQTLVMVPGTPTEAFLESQMRLDPEKTSILRWVCAISYPANVSLEEAEKWYTEVHAKETLQQPGLLRYVSFRSIHEQGTADIMLGESQGVRWIRVSELWYKDFADWRRAVIESPPSYTPPPWGGEYPFVRMDSNFIDLKPDIDFLRGNTPIP